MASKAVVLLSGGLDSTTAMWKIKDNYTKLYALTFVYGSKDEAVSLSISKRLTEIVGASHKIIELSWLEEFSKQVGSTLVSDANPPAPIEGDLDNIKLSSETARAVWVPARNLVFLSIAASFSETLGGNVDMITGFDKEEAATFPDNSIDFVHQMNSVLEFSVFEKNVKVVAPLIEMNKDEIAKLAVKLGVPVEYTSSCYNPLGVDAQSRAKHCGVCESCVRRKRGFRKAGIDPTIYQS